MTHNMAKTMLELRRERESPGLNFLALCCLIQILLGRHFIIENSGASRVFHLSPLKVLSRLGLSTSKVDQ